MDPLSITAGAIAVGTAVTMIAKLSKLLVKLASTSRADLSNEIKFFACHIQGFGTTVDSAKYAMREYAKSHGESNALSIFTKNQTLQNLAFQMKQVVKRIECITQPQVDLKTSFAGAVIKTLIWYHGKREREEVCIWMDRLKLDFLVVLAMITFETLLSREQELKTLLYDHLQFQPEELRALSEELESVKLEL